MSCLPLSVWLLRRALLLGSLCGSIAVVLGCSGEGGRSRTADSNAPVTGMPGAMPALTPEPSGASAAPGELLLDDLSDGDARFASGTISGEWFTYSDGTSMVTPPDHTGLIVSDGQTHVLGQGFSDWGVGLSAYLRSADLSQYCSLKLRARGSGAVVLEVATPATSPPGEGGTCMGTGCFGHFAATLELRSEYQDFELPFTSLVQPSWAQRAELSLAGVISFNLVSKVIGGMANIDLWVDRLALQSCAP